MCFVWKETFHLFDSYTFHLPDKENELQSTSKGMLFQIELKGKSIKINQTAT